MAHRTIAAALALAGLVLLLDRPLASLVLFGAALAVFMDRRGAFGSGLHRALIAFVTALWLGTIGVVTALLALAVIGEPCDDPGCDAAADNFLLLPGLLLLAGAAALLVGSVVAARRARRAGERVVG